MFKKNKMQNDFNITFQQQQQQNERRDQLTPKQTFNQIHENYIR